MFNCDSVKQCLLDGLLCEILDSLPDGTPVEGDKYVMVGQDGNCFTTDTLIIDICGVLDQIQLTDMLEENDIFFIQRPSDGNLCYKVPWMLLSTDCIALTMESGNLRADIITDPSPPSGKVLVTCGPNGLYADGSSVTVNCDTIKKIFESGSDLDSIYGVSGGSCTKVSADLYELTCANLAKLFTPGSSSPTDSFLIASGNVCRKVKADDYFCGKTLDHWEFGTCEEPKIVIQCGNTCKYMTPCDIQDYVCLGLSPGSKRISPLRNGYPTLQTQGIWTFRTKREAQKSSIPIGGLYYLEDKDQIFVKTKQI